MMGSGFMGAGLLFMLLVLVGVVLLVVLLVRALTGNRSAGPVGGRGQSAARRRLDERYAAGELTTEEYEERLRVLSGTG